LSDECVGHFDQLSHEGRENDSGGLSGLDHGLVFLPQIRVVSGGDERGHVERISQELAPALDERLATSLT
jgi:hypothetical protein